MSKKRGLKKLISRIKLIEQQIENLETKIVEKSSFNFAVDLVKKYIYE